MGQLPWLVIQTDLERDALLTSGTLRGLVVHRLKQAGVRDDLAERAAAKVESQETVDRDFGGNCRDAQQWPTSVGQGSPVRPASASHRCETTMRSEAIADG